jgi:hypothetical protein
MSILWGCDHSQLRGAVAVAAADGGAAPRPHLLHLNVPQSASFFSFVLLSEVDL